MDSSSPTSYCRYTVTQLQTNNMQPLTLPDHLAFPVADSKGETNLDAAGLTKREYMATKILAGLVANSGLLNNRDCDAATAVKAAIAITDLMIQELNNPNQ